MSQMNPRIAPENVVISYSGSGFGYAGSADETMDVQPLVTVTLRDMRFDPIVLLRIHWMELACGFRNPDR